MQTFKLNNGITVLYEHMQQIRSVALGIWVCAGSQSENKSEWGMCHFIEHMLFKGTENLSAEQIAERFDIIGGKVNAFTSKEHTCFYAKVLERHFEEAAGILADMLINSSFKEDAVNIEKQVVLEELAMCEDSPEDVAGEIIYTTVWDGQPLGHNILGTRKTIASMTSKKLIKFKNRHYVANNIIISVCGSIPADEVIEKLERLFGEIKPNDNMQSIEKRQWPISEYKVDIKVKKHKIEQCHLNIIFPGFRAADSKNCSLFILNNILGNGMSSRLFRKLREEMGLVYAVYSGISDYLTCGLFGITAIMNANNFKITFETIIDELKAICEDITLSEYTNAKEQVLASVEMGFETNSALSNYMAKQYILHGKVDSVYEIIKEVEEVTFKQVKEIAKECIDFKRISIAAVGANIKKAQIEKIMNNI